MTQSEEEWTNVAVSKRRFSKGDRIVVQLSGEAVIRRRAPASGIVYTDRQGHDTIVFDKKDKKR